MKETTDRSNDSIAQMASVLSQFLIQKCHNDRHEFCEKMLLCMRQCIPQWKENNKEFVVQVQTVAEKMLLENNNNIRNNRMNNKAVSWRDTGNNKNNKSVTQSVEEDENEKEIEEKTEEWQIEYSSLNLGPKIAEGFFGEVSMGWLWGKKVAIKKLKFTSAIEHDAKEKAKTIRKLKEEAAIMSSIRHPNVLLFMGLCSTLPNICLVTGMYCSLFFLHLCFK